MSENEKKHLSELIANAVKNISSENLGTILTYALSIKRKDIAEMILACSDREEHHIITILNEIQNFIDTSQKKLQKSI